MAAHAHNLGNDLLASPRDSEDLRQLFQIVRSGIANREDRVAQPTHAEVAQFLVEKFHAELAGKKRNVLDNG